MKNFFKNAYHRNKFFLFFQLLLLPFMGFATLGIANDGSGATTEEQKALLEKIKISNEQQLADFKKSMDDELEKLKALSKDNMTADEIQKFTNQAAESLRKLEEDFGKKLEQMVKDSDFKTELQKMNDVLEKQGFEIKKLANNPVQAKQTITSKEQHVKHLIAKFMKSDQYKEFADRGFIGQTGRLVLDSKGELIDADSLDEAKRAEVLNKAVGIATDHTGTIFITEPVQRIKDFPIRMNNIRDLMNISTTTSVRITAPEVYSYTDVVDGGTQMLAENGEATDIGFKTKENSWAVCRIAAKLPLSKRYIKTNGINWVVNYLANRLPKFVRVKEDFQLLFGDGSGNNCSGFTKDAQTLTLDRATYVAGDISSVASWNSGTQALITFAAAHGLRSGDNLTIAAATEATYNATHKSVIVVNATSLIINLTYVAEASTALWTGSAVSKWKLSIESAQLFDLLSVAKSELQTAEYEATGAVLNPADFEALGLIKATDNQYVGVSRDAFGRANVNGMPIATTNAMPAGQYLVGDFNMAVELYDYTPLAIRAYEDTTDASKNQVSWIIEEEFILAKYNPYWFMYGYIAADLAKLETV